MSVHSIISNPLFWIGVFVAVPLIAYLVSISQSRKNYELRKNVAVVALAVSVTVIAYILFIAPLQQVSQAAASWHYYQSPSKILGPWDCYLPRNGLPYFYRFDPHGTGLFEGTLPEGRVDDRTLTWNYTRITDDRGTMKITLRKSPRVAFTRASILWAGDYNSFEMIRSKSTSLNCLRFVLEDH